jgi:hypothetical protein
MNFILINPDDTEEIEILNLEKVTKIYKTTRDLEWKKPHGICFESYEEENYEYFSTEEERDLVFNKLVRKIVS